MTEIIIIGGGETGKNLANRLARTKHDIVIVEADKETANRLRKELDISLVIHGDGKDLDVLKKARIEEAESLIALASKDKTNLLICKAAKDISSCRIIARVKKDEYADMLKDVGADIVISATSSTAGLIEKAAVSSGLYGMITMGGEEGDVIEIKVTEDSKAKGNSIENLNLPDLCTVGLIRRNGKPIAPRGGTVFQKDDQVILVGTKKELIPTIPLFHPD